MWFRYRGPRVSPITDEELVSQPGMCSMTWIPCRLILIARNQSIAAMNHGAASQRDDPDSQLLRAVNCFTMPSDFSSRDWDMWQQYSKWYLNHIKRKIRVWMADEEFRRRFQVLNPNDQQASNTQPPSTSDTMLLLSKVATSLRDGRSSLSDIILSLLQTSEGYTNGVGHIEDRFVSFQEGEDPLDIQRGRKCQVVFVLLSCILLLYSPSLSPQTSHLQIQLNDPDDEEKVLRSHLLKKSSCLLTADVATLTLEHLLNCFGHLRFQPISESSRDHKPIITSNINYHILSRIAEIRIVWVDCLSLHLEFDWRTMTLKLFRFPSFCAMLALPRESKVTIFDR